MEIKAAGATTFLAVAFTANRIVSLAVGLCGSTNLSLLSKIYGCMANAAPELANTFSDYAGHLRAGESAWADLDAVTFAAQLSAGGADYFFTMGVVDILMTIGDIAITATAANEQWQRRSDSGFWFTGSASCSACRFPLASIA